jgi:hypothetical protein
MQGVVHHGFDFSGVIFLHGMLVNLLYNISSEQFNYYYLEAGESIREGAKPPLFLSFPSLISATESQWQLFQVGEGIQG